MTVALRCAPPYYVLSSERPSAAHTVLKKDICVWASLLHAPNTSPFPGRQDLTACAIARRLAPLAASSRSLGCWVHVRATRRASALCLQSGSYQPPQRPGAGLLSSVTWHTRTRLALQACPPLHPWPVSVHAACNAILICNVVRCTGGVTLLIALLNGAMPCAVQRHAASTLYQLVQGRADVKTAMVAQGVTRPLVALLQEGLDPHSYHLGGADATEPVVAVLSELARSHKGHRAAIVEAGGLPPILRLACEGMPAVLKHAIPTLWALAQDAHLRPLIAEPRAVVHRLTELLRAGEGELPKVAAATMLLLAQDEGGREQMITAGAAGPLFTIAMGSASWLRNQAVRPRVPRPSRVLHPSRASETLHLSSSNWPTILRAIHDRTPTYLTFSSSHIVYRLSSSASSATPTQLGRSRAVVPPRRA